MGSSGIAAIAAWASAVASSKRFWPASAMDSTACASASSGFAASTRRASSAGEVVATLVEQDCRALDSHGTPVQNFRYGLTASYSPDLSAYRT